MFGPLRNHFRRVGHRHRRAERWDKAADAYAWHVRLHPNDFPDWIRLAETSLAAGRLDGAVRAFRHLSEQGKGDPDKTYQLAQYLKARGENAEALAMFQKALLLSERGLRDTQALRADPQTPVPGTVLYSVQDMIGYLSRHVTVTGIQRVQAGIVRHLLRGSREGVGFVLTDADGNLRPGDFGLLDPSLLLAVIDAAEAPNGDHAYTRALIAQCRASARPIRPGSGHTLIVLGAFWALGNAPTRYLPAKRRGARIGVYLYDLIPITHPQFCEMELSLHFAVGFGQICALADFFVTISEDTADRVRALLADQSMVPVPIQAVPLAHALADVSDCSAPPHPYAPPRAFVAYISTIEGRKNHIYVARVWRALLAKNVAVPDLLFVGRPGWKIDELRTFLADTNYLDGRIRLLHDLTDAELANIYRRASFTIFTSFVEGWGLPIGESLAYGTPCVASSTSSMPEVGGDFVDYVDPFDIDDGMAVIEALLVDPAALENRRRRIAEHFKPRTWDVVGHDFARAVESLSQSAPRGISPPMLAAGQTFRPGDTNAADFSLPGLMRSPRGLLLAELTSGLDDAGAWMGAGEALIRFRSDLPPGTPLSLILSLRRGEHARHDQATIATDRDTILVALSSLPAFPDQARDIVLESLVSPDGTVAIRLTVDGGAPSADLPLLGVAGIGYRSA